MKQTSELVNERIDKDILFSKTVKAGKRVYYIDVKRDRKGALYLSITESKKVKDGTEEERPVFEKHKIFLYREDMEKFMSAMDAATDYAITNAPIMEENFGENAENVSWLQNPGESRVEGRREDRDYRDEGNRPDDEGKIKFDIDF